LQKKLTGHCRVVLNYSAENCLQGKMLTMPLNLEAIKKEIVEQLKPLDPEKVILFGSYAYGQPTEESDIDLYIVTKDDFIPQSYQEKRELVRRISRHIHALRQEVCIDLLVHTHAMHHQFAESDSGFARDLLKRGVSLI